MDLEQQLRKARVEGNEIEIFRIKELMGILTRNMETITVRNKKGDILSVRQVIKEIVPISKQRDTEEIDIYI